MPGGDPIPAGALALATALQIGDSQFPAGGFAFSWGLEALWRAGRVDRGGFAAFLTAQLHGRWARFDRPVVAAAHAGERDGRIALDLEVEAMSWSAPLRDGSRRAGGALLATHARLLTPGAADYREAVVAGRAPGHLPVVQGLVGAGLGLDGTSTLVLSASGFAGGLASAAVRLGIVGALAAQQHLSALRPVLADLASAAPPAAPASFSPLSEIGMGRHSDLGGTLFAN
jgi:urease accessory protein